jgi:DNA-binding transcriptional regulator of glucitol operon
VPVTRRRRFAQIILVIVAACGCLTLGWWQWTRFESTSGSFQNLGYALQWPMFAGFCIYAYRKFVRYEDEPPESAKASAITEVPVGLLPERPHASKQSTELDPAMREYNAYLAQLTQADQVQADQVQAGQVQAKQAQDDQAAGRQAGADKQNRTTA